MQGFFSSFLTFSSKTNRDSGLRDRVQVNDPKKCKLGT